MKVTFLATVGLIMATGAYGAEPLSLTFQRTGTTAESVNVTASIDGVTASLTSLSHAIKGVGNTIICADVNGNASPTIVYKFSLSGLPDGWTFNNVGLDIHALNASGANQSSNDGKKRHFNVSVTSGETQLVSYTDLDPAAGITGVRKVWEAATASTIVPSNPYELTITVTKGTTNDGCFFGLEGITLSTTEGGDTPTPPSPGETTIYTIKWKNNTQNYITEQRNGSLAIGEYSVHKKIFWEFIPTGKEDCYYIKSIASGKYIGSCNMAPASSSRVMMSDEPVEYYVHMSAATSGDNKGCYWLSSTDCENYSDETSQARCLNKDGASNYIITWKTSVANTGSYWTLVPTENLYEPLPTIPVHTPYALRHQLYQIPCGTIGDTWISQVTIGSDFYYPMAGKDMAYPTVTSKPSKYYNILTLDAANVFPGSDRSVNIKLNKVPAEDYKLYLYADYDRDGLFEYSKELQCAQNCEATLSIPDAAKLGRTRMRLRLTNNGMAEADDDVNGETLDLLLNITEASAELIAPEVKVNDSTRGDAKWSNGVAEAKSRGNALFLYWSEGHRICSVDAQYTIASSNVPRTLTAYFTANTDKLDGIDPVLLNRIDENAGIVYDGEFITVTNSHALSIMLFAVNGQCAACVNAQTLSTAGLAEGIYIVKAITSNGVVSAKIKK